MATNVYRRTVPVNRRAFGVNVELNLTGFNKAIDDYLKWQKRLPSAVINSKLFYVARNATLTTRQADPTKIESDLRGPAKEYDAPLAAVIINSRLGKGQGLTGAKMAKEIEKLIRKRKAAVGFVRAGWKNAIQMLEAYMRSKGELNTARRWAPPVDKGTMKKRNTEALGKATVAPIERVGSVWGEIQNDTHGKGDTGRLDEIKLKGLQEAVNREVRSMYIYLERKINPTHDAFNRKQRF